MKLSLVVPCFNEQDNVFPFFDICTEAFKNKVADYEFVFVNDGSRDNTWKQLRALKNEHPEAKIKLVNFSRNFGKESAIYAGLNHADGDYVSLIDADLQQRPEVVLQMLELLEADEELDCVTAYQNKRREGKFMTLCKSMFYKVINAICDIDFHPNASDP